MSCKLSIAFTDWVSRLAVDESNSFITDLPFNGDNGAELAAGGRARWKIENETFKVLKTTG